MTADHEPITQSSARRLRAELDFTYELCQTVASKSELQPILEWIVQKTIGMFSTEEGSIRLIEQDENPETGRTRMRRVQPGIEAGSWPPMISTIVMGFLMTYGEPLASADLLNDPRFPALKGSTSRIRSVLAVPLRVGNRFTGMLAVTQSTSGRTWSKDEAQLLSIVGMNSASVIEQARLKIEADEKRRLEERQRQLERDLEAARVIQVGLLPSRPLAAGSWEIAGRVVPARQVGGDSFDFFALPDGRVGVMIADVSGKGFPAALLMSNVQGSVRAHCNGSRPIADAIRLVNGEAMRTANGKFITMFYAELDVARGRVRYTNAGHNYPLIRRADGALVELPTGGLPLGLLDDAHYDEGECTLGPGDALLLYSDGIPDAEDERRADFGEERLRELWARLGMGAPRAVIDGVFAAIDTFRGRQSQTDDMTLVVIGRPEVV